MKITAEFYLPSMIPSRDIEHHNIVRSFKRDDINKSFILLSD